MGQSPLRAEHLRILFLPHTSFCSVFCVRDHVNTFPCNTFQVVWGKCSAVSGVQKLACKKYALALIP